MPNRERAKGVKGEREVAAIYAGAGLIVHGLEGAGDHVIADGFGVGLHLHSEVKRQETARPWAWYEQASCEAEPGSVPVVAFRRNKSPWLALIALHELAQLAADAAAWRLHRDEQEA